MRPFSLCLILLLTSGCAGLTEKIPGVYRIDVQQGNVVEQPMLDQLERGMDKSQVRFILGTPILIDPFHTHRWEYIYTFKRGLRTREQRHITVHFDENERLSYLSGDIKTGDGLRYLAEEDRAVPQRTIDVPADRSRRGMFGWFGGRSPTTGRAEAESEAEPATPAEQQVLDDMEVLDRPEDGL